MKTKKWDRNKKIIIPIFIILTILVIIGTSYALWQITLKQTNSNIITTGCFNIEFQDKNPINLGDNVYPINDEEGKQLIPYEFTLTNTCQSEATYYINLETVSNGEKVLNEKYLKANLVEGEKKVFLNTLKDTYLNTEKVITESSKAFKLAKGVLKGNESKTYSLRLWLDKDTPAIDEVMDATYEGKITISLSYVPKADENQMMAPRDINNDIYAPLSDTNKLVFLNNISPVGEIEPIDISINKTGSILAYVDRTNQDNIVTYIKANGIILFPEDSSALFHEFTNLSEIEGLENVNTYYVTDMQSMFNGCSSLTNLDLSTFDTSNLKVMFRMFYGMTQLENLDLSNFDTSNVEEMSEAFQDCSLDSLDLSHFNTSKTINMYGLFRNSNFTSLNLSNWDVSNVIAGSGLFSNLSFLDNLNVSNWIVSSERISDFFQASNCSPINYINASNWYWKEIGDNYEMFGFYLSDNIKTLDISNWTFNNNASIEIHIPNETSENLIAKNWVFSEKTDLSNFFNDRVFKTVDLSGWDTSKVTSMEGMFINCSNLTDLNLSSFNTSQVTDMSYMFYGCSSLTNLNLSSFDTSKVTDMSYMFYGCSSLTNLNLSSFDTSKVIDLSFMFTNNQSLVNITYSNKFIYHNNMLKDSMFDECPANKPSHSSWNNVFPEDENEMV